MAELSDEYRFLYLMNNATLSPLLRMIVSDHLMLDSSTRMSWGILVITTFVS